MKQAAMPRITWTAENDVLREFFDTSPDCLLILDTARTTVIHANTAFLQLTGLEPGELRGCALTDLGLFGPADTRKLGEALGETLKTEFDNMAVRLAGGNQARCRVLLRSCETGGRRYTELRLNDAGRRARQIDEVKRVNDILEQRVAERTAELKQTNQELEAFSYSVSHDLRAPLRRVIGFAGILRQESGAGLRAAQRKHLESITSAAQRMNELIDDLLAFSQIGQSELHKRPVDMRDLLQAARNDLQRETEGRDVEWLVHPLPIVRADHSLLRQAMVNLLSNALKFTAPRQKARIEIGSSTLDPEETVVFIRDNGVGFDQRYAGRLFGVFQRLHDDRDFRGTGIGLANVKQIIRRHGGRVWAEGKAGEGATFYFSLPNSASPRPETENT